MGGSSEIKSRDKVYPKDFRTMQDVALKLDNKWRAGLVVFGAGKSRKLLIPGFGLLPPEDS
jgi:hypothetical protein